MRTPCINASLTASLVGDRTLPLDSQLQLQNSVTALALGRMGGVGPGAAKKVVSP